MGESTIRVVVAGGLFMIGTWEGPLTGLLKSPMWMTPGQGGNWTFRNLVGGPKEVSIPSTIAIVYEPEDALVKQYRELTSGLVLASSMPQAADGRSMQ